MSPVLSNSAQDSQRLQSARFPYVVHSFQRVLERDAAVRSVQVEDPDLLAVQGIQGGLEGLLELLRRVIAWSGRIVLCIDPNDTFEIELTNKL